MCIGESNSILLGFGQNLKHGQYTVWNLFFFVFLFDSFKVREASAGTVYGGGLSFCPCKTVTTFDLVP